MRRLFQWGTQAALAGGIDKDGSRAAELLRTGFAAVEFGTVTPPAPGQPAATAAILAGRLAHARLGQTTRARIGIGLGMHQASAAEALAADWHNGLLAAWPAADYLSFNLSAAAYRPLLTTEHLPPLRHALATVANTRSHLRNQTGRDCGLALKLPLSLPVTHALAMCAAAVGFDALIAVLPNEAGAFDRLHALAEQLRGGAALIAVGGLRDHAGMQAALAAGADGIQVHRAFVEQGQACLSRLRGSPSSGS